VSALERRARVDRRTRRIRRITASHTPAQTAPPPTLRDSEGGAACVGRSGECAGQWAGEGGGPWARREAAVASRDRVASFLRAPGALARRYLCASGCS
jgi:hypothetical protein